jgi:hypothetical protein
MTVCGTAPLNVVVLQGAHEFGGVAVHGVLAYDTIDHSRAQRCYSLQCYKSPVALLSAHEFNIFFSFVQGSSCVCVCDIYIYLKPDLF